MAAAKGREVRPVGTGKVRVGSEVDKMQVDDELNDLHSGQVLLPPYLGTTRRRVIVVVHKDMNGQVLRDNSPRNACLSVELGKAKEGCCRMMVHMQEG